jgi:hypothetical protein
MTRPTLTPEVSERLQTLFDKAGRNPDDAFGTEGSTACFAAGQRLFVEGCYTATELRFLADLLDTVHTQDAPDKTENSASLPKPSISQAA